MPIFKKFFLKQNINSGRMFPQLFQSSESLMKPTIRCAILLTPLNPPSLSTVRFLSISLVLDRRCVGRQVYFWSVRFIRLNMTCGYSPAIYFRYYGTTFRHRVPRVSCILPPYRHTACRLSACLPVCLGKNTYEASGIIAAAHGFGFA